MIVVISSKSDTHAAAVLAELEALQEPATLLDLSEFPLNSRLSMNYANSQTARFDWSAETGSIDFSQVRSIWWRRPQSFRMDPDFRDQGYLSFAFNESHEAITGLWQSLDVFWINNPALDAAAQRKAYQLRVAQKLGISIPETLITNDPAEARRFIESHGRVICKAFSATHENWRETRLVGPEELACLENVRFAPVIFQPYIEAVYDLRITVVGDEIFPAAIYSQESAYAIDCRIDIGRSRIEAVSLPEQQQDQLRRLMDTLGLVYGAIDMRLQPDGTYVFLEINPAGQFLFIETATRQPIARTLASALVRAGSSGAGCPATATFAGPPSVPGEPARAAEVAPPVSSAAGGRAGSQ